MVLTSGGPRVTRRVWYLLRKQMDRKARYPSEGKAGGLRSQEEGLGV